MNSTLYTTLLAATIGGCLSFHSARAEEEEGRIFQQPARISYPFADSFDVGNTTDEFPAGWNAGYVDAGHHFRISADPPSRSEPFTEPNALELIAEDAPKDKPAAMLFLIFPQRDGIWLQFDFFYTSGSQKTLFRAGLGDSAAIQVGLLISGNRYFALTRREGKEVTEAIPSEYLRPGEWNTIQLGQNGSEAFLILNGQEISLGDQPTTIGNYIKFVIGDTNTGSAPVFIDNVKVNSARIE